MATKTRKSAQPVEVNEYRVHLQQELLTRDAVEKQWREACEALKMAEEMVRNGDKSPPYLTRFLAEIRRLHDRMREIDGIPQLLRNSCQDHSLREKSEIAREVRNNLRREWMRGKNEVDAVKQTLEVIKLQISARLGAGAELNDGDKMPWTRLQDEQWAHCGSGLFFSPKQSAFHSSNLADFQEQWIRRSRELKMAEVNLQSITDRSDIADAEFNRLYDEMTNSPI
jgi:hypothetical protein